MRFRKIILLLLSFVLLCSACHRADPPIAESNPTSTPPKPSQPTPETTEPTTVPTEPEPEIPLWYIEDPQYLSYEDFFAEDRPLTSYRYLNSWYIRKDDTLHRARLDWRSEAAQLFVQCSSNSHLVPGCDNLTNFYLIGSDSHYAYLSSATDVVQVDLLTGEQKTVLTCERLIDIFLLDGVVLFYCAEDAGQWNIYQMYLPSSDVDILYEGIPADTPPYFFNLAARRSTQGPVSWSMLNPEMTAILRKELPNPDSIYKISNFMSRTEPDDLSSIWGKMDLDSADGYNAPPYALLHIIQTHTGIHTWAGYTYNPADGTCEESTAIIDKCWYGSGYSHDHSDPHEYDMTPEWNVSDPVPISDIYLPEEPQKMYEEDVYADHEPNCIYIEGFICQGATRADVYDILFEIDLTEVKFAPDYIYGITPDNTIVQASYDGTVRNTIYTADGILSDLEYGCGKLYFLEDNTIMEIDIPAKTCRSLLDIPQYTYFSMYLDDANVLFFENARGLTVGMYIADFSQMTLKETHRL